MWNVVQFIYVENDYYQWCVYVCDPCSQLIGCAVHWAELNGAAYQHLLNTFKCMHNNKFQIDIG